MVYTLSELGVHAAAMFAQIGAGLFFLLGLAALTWWHHKKKQQPRRTNQY